MKVSLLPQKLRFHMTPLLLAFSASLMACGEATEDYQLNASTHAIVNGQIDDRFPAIGVLRTKNNVGCSATLIGPQTVLTAGHCVSHQEEVAFLVGGQKSRTIYAQAVTVHPRYEGGNKADIAIVHLSEAVHDVTPLKLVQLTPQEGQSLLIVGYGSTSEESTGLTGVHAPHSSFGVKHSAASTIDRVYDELFSFSGQGGNVCDGDSGGPTFVHHDGEYQIIGVHSTKAGACGALGLDTRIDVFRTWIYQMAKHDLSSMSNATAVDVAKQTNGVEFITPIANDRLGSEFSISVAASSGMKTIRQVDIYIDDAYMLSLYQAPYTFNVSQLSDGVHTLKAIAIDDTGKESSATIQIIVGNGQFPVGQCIGDECAEQNTTGVNGSSNVSQGCSVAGSNADASLLFLLIGFVLIRVTRRSR